MNLLISLLHSRAGGAIQWLVGIFVGWISTQLVAAGIEVSPKSLDQLTLALTGLGAFLVTFAVQWYQARQAQKLQATLGAKPDGWIGSSTLAIAQGARELALKTIKAD